LLLGALSLLAGSAAARIRSVERDQNAARHGREEDKPYAQPGDDVNLQLLWHDPKGRADVQRFFLGGCVNPPGDLYYGCFGQYGEKFAKGTLPPPGMGDTYQVSLPSDIISGRGPGEPGQPRYGLYIVFLRGLRRQDRLRDEPTDQRLWGPTGDLPRRERQAAWLE